MTESTTVTEEKESIEENVKVDKVEVEKGDVVEEVSKGKSEKATEEVSGDKSSSDAIADSLLSFLSDMNLADPAVSAEIIDFNLFSEIIF